MGHRGHLRVEGIGPELGMLLVPVTTLNPRSDPFTSITKVGSRSCQGAQQRYSSVSTLPRDPFTTKPAAVASLCLITAIRHYTGLAVILCPDSLDCPRSDLPRWSTKAHGLCCPPDEDQNGVLGIDDNAKNRICPPRAHRSRWRQLQRWSRRASGGCSADLQRGSTHGSVPDISSKLVHEV